MLFIPVSRFLNLDAESYLNSNLNQILDSNPDQSDVVHFEGRKLQRFCFESRSVGPSTVPQPRTNQGGNWKPYKSIEEPANEDFDSTTLKLVNWSLNIMTYTFFNCVIFFYLMYRVSFNRLTGAQPSHRSKYVTFSVGFGPNGTNNSSSFIRIEAIWRHVPKRSWCIWQIRTIKIKTRNDRLPRHFGSISCQITTWWYDFPGS